MVKWSFPGSLYFENTRKTLSQIWYSQSSSSLNLKASINSDNDNDDGDNDACDEFNDNGNTNGNDKLLIAYPWPFRPFS